MASAAYAQDAPLMPGDRVECIDGRHGFVVAPAAFQRWRILFDDRTLGLVPARELRRETVEVEVGDE